MAATAWAFYNSFREKLGEGDFDLSGTSVNFTMSLHTSAASANATNAVLSTYASIANEVANGNGYTTGGKSVSGRTWAAGASAGVFRFDSTAVVWTATGGDVDSVKFAIIYQSGGKLVCYSKLSTSQFNLTQDNTLTVTPSSNGIFELT